MTHSNQDNARSQPLPSDVTPAAGRLLSAWIGDLHRILTIAAHAGGQWQRPARALPLCVALALGLIGCASGFTGGGIPTGRSTVIGKVVRADRPTVPVPNALVYITVTVMGRGVPGGRATNSYPFYTDNNGGFAAVNVPTDQISSNASITITPNDTTLQAQKVAFVLTNGRPSNVILALPPSDFPLNKVSTIKLTEQSSTPPPNASAVYRAQVLDGAGNDLGILPSLVFDGSLATITADGAIEVVANPTVTNPVVGSALGIVTGTVDTHNTGSPPSTSVDPPVPTSSGPDGPVILTPPGR